MSRAREQRRPAKPEIARPRDRGHAARRPTSSRVHAGGRPSAELLSPRARRCQRIARWRDDRLDCCASLVRVRPSSARRVGHRLSALSSVELGASPCRPAGSAADRDTFLELPRSAVGSPCAHGLIACRSRASAQRSRAGSAAPQATSGRNHRPSRVASGGHFLLVPDLAAPRRARWQFASPAHRARPLLARQVTLPSFSAWSISTSARSRRVTPSTISS